MLKPKFMLLNPCGSNSGLTTEEQNAFRKAVRDKYERGDYEYKNPRSREQSIFMKQCISCMMTFQVYHEEYYRTECPDCRTKPGALMVPPTRKMLRDFKLVCQESDRGGSSKKYASDARIAIDFAWDDIEAALIAMRSLEEKYPNKGWAEEADELEIRSTKFAGSDASNPSSEGA